jgi:hypothetical protein
VHSPLSFELVCESLAIQVASVFSHFLGVEGVHFPVIVVDSWLVCSISVIVTQVNKHVGRHIIILLSKVAVGLLLLIVRGVSKHLGVCLQWLRLVVLVLGFLLSFAFRFRLVGFVFDDLGLLLIVFVGINISDGVSRDSLY